MTRHSIVEDYTKIDAAITKRLGGHTSAEALLDSCGLSEIAQLQITEDLDGCDPALTETARPRVSGRPEAVAIATMTKCQGNSTLAILVTLRTMFKLFYAGRLEAQSLTTDSSRARYFDIRNDLMSSGVDAVTPS